MAPYHYDEALIKNVSLVNHFVPIILHIMGYKLGVNTHELRAATSDEQ